MARARVAALAFRSPESLSGRTNETDIPPKFQRSNAKRALACRMRRPSFPNTVTAAGDIFTLSNLCEIKTIAPTPLKVREGDDGEGKCRKVQLFSHTTLSSNSHIQGSVTKESSFRNVPMFSIET